MPQTEFKSQNELQDYAERNGLEYAWEYAPAFAKRQRLLPSEQYELVEVRTTRGVSRAMLFSKAIIQAEWEADAPLREAMAIKHERWRAKERPSNRRPSSGQQVRNASAIKVEAMAGEAEPVFAHWSRSSWGKFSPWENAAHDPPKRKRAERLSRPARGSSQKETADRMPIRQAAASRQIRGMGKAVIGAAASVPAASPGVPSWDSR